MKLFGSSGVRGVVNSEVTPTFAQRLGSSIATIYEGGEFVLGRDVRVTGPMLEKAISSGITSCGGDVRLLGLLPTPTIAWLTRELEANVGIAVTASHNPPHYNGFKIFNSTGMSVTEKEQEQIEKNVESGNLDFAPWDGVGFAESVSVTDLYIESVVENIKINREWMVACDLFCGATTTLVPEAFDAVGLSPSMINAHIDGHFPAGNPEPTMENLNRLGAFTKLVGAEIGFAFDGDGDRMMAVDEKGIPVSGNRLLAAYAKYMVETSGGGTVVTHIGASMCIDEMVEQAGGKVVRTKVGDVYITEEMIRRKAIFGGEPIGAWIIPSIHMCPDGTLCALKLLEALEDTEMSISEFAGQAPAYPIVSTKIEVKDKYMIMKAIEKKYSNVFSNVLSINRVDGVRLQLPEGWILIRASGTEPLIRITAEGRDYRATESLIEHGKMLLKEDKR